MPEIESDQYLRGVLAAYSAVRGITGPLKRSELPEQAWDVIRKIHETLLALAKTEGRRS